MPYPYYHQVQRAESELKAEGQIQQRTNQTDVENDKGLICRRAAYYVNTENNPSHGLMEKTEGNNSMGYSVDWILQSTNGEGWDTTTDTDGMAAAVNGDSHGPNPDYIPRWRQPTRELAGLAPVNPEPPPVDEMTDEELLEYLKEMEQRIIAASDAGDQRTLDRLNSIIDQAEATLKKIALLLVMRRPEDPPIEEDNPTVLILKILKSITATETTVAVKKK